MYVYVYVYVCVCVCVRAYIYVYIYIHAYIHTYIYTHTPATSIQIIILWYSKSNMFLDKLLVHSGAATSNCRWLMNFCMDSSKIWCATGNCVRTTESDVVNLY